MFSHIWLENDTLKENFLAQVSNESQYANELLNFSDEQWQKTSKYHNLDDYNSRILVLEEDIVMDNLLQSTNVIEIDGKNFKDSDLELFNHLHLVIKEYDKDEYSFGHIKVTIKNKNPLNNIIVKNPPFNMDLLKIES